MTRADKPCWLLPRLLFPLLSRPQNESQRLASTRFVRIELLLATDYILTLHVRKASHFCSYSSLHRSEALPKDAGRWGGPQECRTTGQNDQFRSETSRYHQ